MAMAQTAWRVQTGKSRFQTQVAQRRSKGMTQISRKSVVSSRSWDVLQLTMMSKHVKTMEEGDPKSGANRFKSKVSYVSAQEFDQQR